MTMHVSRFHPDAARMAEFVACLWQGDGPDGFTLHQWLYLVPGPGMLMIWEGDEQGQAWVEERLGTFGELRTETVTDATPGLATCVARDLAGFGAWLAERGTAPIDVERQLDVRRRGMQATSLADAAAAGRAWLAEQQPT